MKKYPFHLITGEGLGVSYSSNKQVGSLSPDEAMGQAQVDVFCNITNGNVAIADHPLPFAEISQPVLLGYFFNSQAPLVKNAWRLPVSSFTAPSSDQKQLVFTETDGHQTIYSKNGALYFAPGLVKGTPYLQFDETRYQWFWYHPGTGMSAIYDKYGTLLQRRDAWGNRTNYTYSSDGQLASIQGPSGNQYVIDRVNNSDGSRQETVSIIHPGGGKLPVQQYLFDKKGLLVTSTAGSYQTNYQYLATADKVQISAIQQTDGTLIEFAYDASWLQTIYLSGGATRVDFIYRVGMVSALCVVVGRRILCWIRNRELARSFNIMVSVPQIITMTLLVLSTLFPANYKK